MNVLIACEESGTVRDAFIERGHNAISCDLLPGRGKYHKQHHQGDVISYLRLTGDRWDMIIAHPECTYLCNSGVSHLHTDASRWGKLDKAAKFFSFFVNFPCDKKVIENPIPHKYAIERIGQKYTQIIHPYMFGHLERKATCLWLYGVPELVETNNVKAKMELLPKREQQRMHYLPPSKNRKQLRSVTYSGIAEAMAEQWGDL